MKKLAQVTVELRNLLKTDFELFDFPYEFDDISFAKELEKAVIDYYYLYEIGQPTPEQFKLIFRRRWLQAVGYYNKLHNTTLLEYNPLINHKMSEALEQLSKSNRKQDSKTDGVSHNTTEYTFSEDSSEQTQEDIDNSTSEETTQTGNSTNTRTDDLESKTNSSDTMSDYPQQSIAGGDYLSGQRLSDSDTTNTGTVKDQGNTTNDSNTTGEGSSQTVGERTAQQTGDKTTTEDGTTNTVGMIEDIGTENTEYEKTIEGLTGITYQELIQKERDNLIRITGMVIEELKPCFILVY